MTVKGYRQLIVKDYRVTAEKEKDTLPIYIKTLVKQLFATITMTTKHARLPMGKVRHDYSPLTKTLLVSLLTVLGMVTGHAQQLPMKLWYDKPAEYFEESLPIGNGKLGALVYGNPADDIIFLNDLTFWTGKPVDANLDAGASRWLPEVRKALFAEDYKLADSLQRHLQGPNSQFYQPIGTLHIRDVDSTPATNYYRELDLDSSLVKARYTKGGIHYTREYFASNPDKLIAIRIKADKQGGINTDISLTAQVPHKVKASGSQLTLTGHATGDPKESIHYCTIIRVFNTGGTVSANDSTLTLRDVSEATIYYVNETSFNGFDKHPVKEGAPYIETVTDEAWHLQNDTYEAFRQRHIADYRQFFPRLTLHLDGTRFNDEQPTDQLLKAYTDDKTNDPYLETLYFQYGRYLLISSSRTPGVPANLQGLWTPHKFSPWRGNYTVNINLEENYWPAETANLSEMAAPLWGFIEALAKTGSNVARNYYGIQRGWCSSHNSDIWAMANPVGEKRESPMWSNWNMGGAWLSQALWEHYLFTQDEAFLRDTALPLLSGASEFMLDWLIPNPHDATKLFTAPSTSPENEYKTFDGYIGTTCYGGAADLAIIRELFLNTTQAMSLLQPDSPLLGEINSKLGRLQPYSIGRHGDLNEWYYDWDDRDTHHRHQSHLIGLHPGHHINIYDTPTLATACARTLEQKGDNSTGWSTGWRINLWARLHRADQAYHIYQKLLQYVTPDNYQGEDKRRSGGTYPNLFDAHPPFQIDGNFGGTAGVCEMLVQSSAPKEKGGDYVVELLPALPPTWTAGEVKGIRARGGYEIAMTWKDARVEKLDITARKSGKVTIKYNGETRRVKVKANQTTTVR